MRSITLRGDAKGSGDTPPKEVKCSLCGKLLKPIGNIMEDLKQNGATIVAGSQSGWDQWLGTVCTSCRNVYCPDCRDVGPGQCPKCGEKVAPAMASFLP